MLSLVLSDCLESSTQLPSVITTSNTVLGGNPWATPVPFNQVPKLEVLGRFPWGQKPMTEKFKCKSWSLLRLPHNLGAKFPFLSPSGGWAQAACCSTSLETTSHLLASWVPAVLHQPLPNQGPTEVEPDAASGKADLWNCLLHFVECQVLKGGAVLHPWSFELYVQGDEECSRQPLKSQQKFLCHFNKPQIIIGNLQEMKYLLTKIEM